MSTYESGYDPKYGYNRNAFAHKTVGTSIMGGVVKLISSPIGLVSEAVHSKKEKKQSSSSQKGPATTRVPPTGEEPSTELPESPSSGRLEKEDSVFVSLSPDKAEELIASGQAEPADGQEPTHELVPEDAKDDGIERDEMDWTLDETSAAIEDGEPEALPNEDEQPASQETGLDITKHSPPPYEKSLSKLPFPVVLPQRRPGTKTRGFVRAYAPILQYNDISEAGFLTFLKSFHKAVQASPIFDVVMIATAIAGLYPDLVVGLAVQAVQVAAGIGQEIQERYRTNRFLAQANKDLFMPRGLFAMIVKYKPGKKDQPGVTTERVDLGAAAVVEYGGDLAMSDDTAVAEGEQENKTKTAEMKEKMKRLRVADGETHGEGQMPVTCAPIVFPTLDAAAATDSSAQAKSSKEGMGSVVQAKSKSASKFVSDYYDRRAQASYAYQNPDSTLTAQVASKEPNFKSRYADPNNATNKHLFTLITGGRYKAEPLGARRRYERAQRKAAEKRAQGIKEASSKRLLQEDVLYLMVVNMPTKEELEKAKMQNQQSKKP